MEFRNKFKLLLSRYFGVDHPLSSNKRMERFTKRSQRVLFLAQEAAEQRHDSSIRVDHLVLGLLREEGSVARATLTELEPDVNKIEQAVYANMPPIQSSNNEIKLDDETKQLLELTINEAIKMGNHYLGTEHLLLAIISLPETAAFRALLQLDLTPEKLRAKVMEVLARQPMTANQKDEPRNVKSFIQPFQEAIGWDLLTGRHWKYSALQQQKPNEIFTIEAREVLQRAQEVAEKQRYATIHVEHILIGLLYDVEIAGQTLREFGLRRSVIEQAILDVIPKDTSKTPPELSKQVKRLLKNAVDEARIRKQHKIQPVHLLLGLTRLAKHKDSKIIMQKIGVDSDTLRTRLRAHLQDTP